MFIFTIFAWIFDKKDIMQILYRFPIKQQVINSNSCEFYNYSSHFINELLDINIINNKITKIDNFQY
jgi:hypothetical protein